MQNINVRFFAVKLFWNFWFQCWGLEIMPFLNLSSFRCVLIKAVLHRWALAESLAHSHAPIPACGTNCAAGGKYTRMHHSRQSTFLEYEFIQRGARVRKHWLLLFTQQKFRLARSVPHGARANLNISYFPGPESERTMERQQRVLYRQQKDTRLNINCAWCAA